MKLLYRLLGQKPDSREGVITVTSGLNVIVNLAVAAVKILIGLAASSIAIVSEGLHGGADAATSLLAILGVKLAGKRPDEKHPFGYGRVEYLTSLVIALLILYAGLEIFTASVDLIFHPAELAIDYLTLAIVAATAAVKFFLGVYTIRKGGAVKSDSLTALGLECRNDSYASIITIASALVFLIWGISLDAWAGLVTALLILKAGFGILASTVNDLLGRSGDKELAAQLYREIRATPGVANAADMILHNYGPDAWSGSVNLEIDHEQTVGQVYSYLHELQLRIMHEHQVTMVFGIYAVDNKTESSRTLRRQIARFVRTREHIKSYHALYRSETEQRIYCDFVVEYGKFDWEEIRRDFERYMKELYPDYSVELVIETEFV